MKIIKEGTKHLDLDNPITITCTTCESILEYTQNDVYIGTGIKIDCGIPRDCFNHYIKCAVCLTPIKIS